MPRALFWLSAQWAPAKQPLLPRLPDTGLIRVVTFSPVRIRSSTRFHLTSAGLYVGETRNAETLQFGLQFARSYEPVVTTYHAGSIGDAITSLYQVSELPYDVARSAIGNVLNSVVYVNLAYTAKGVAVPVIMVLPINDAAIRANLLTGNQQQIGRFIDDACAGTRPFEGQISRREAIARALAAGATKESIDAALPPETKGETRQGAS